MSNLSDLERAKMLLIEGDYTCVLCKNELVYRSKATGIAPMMEFIAQNVDLDGFSVADKVVGKAVTLLFALKGVRRVYAQILSKSALNLMTNLGIDCSFDRLVESIVNREATGICPMEQAVFEIDQPSEAYTVLANRLACLRAGKGEK